MSLMKKSADSTIEFCQVFNCQNLRFTFCPHCSQNICIQCLNEHYQSMEEEYLNDVNYFQTSFNANRSSFVEEQQNKLNQIYENSLNQQSQYKTLLDQLIGHEARFNLTQFQSGQHAEMKQQLEKLNCQRIQFDHLFDQIQTLLVEFEKTSSKFVSNPSIDEDSDGPMIVELDDDESTNQYEFLETENSTESSTGFHSFEDFGKSFLIDSADTTEKNGKSNRKLTTIALKQYRSNCPFTKHSFGLQSHHCGENKIVNIPCQQRSRKKTPLLYYHLPRYHHFNGLTALKIIRCLMKSENDLDLLSEAPVEEILGNPIAWHSCPCPLNRYGLFGILREHRIKLCDERRRHAVVIHHHFVTIHHLQHRFASKLVRAIIDHCDPNVPIFQPDENITRD